MTPDYLECIKKLYGNKALISDIAEKLDTDNVAVQMNVYLNDERPVGAVISQYDLTSEYIEKYPEECFVLVTLTDGALCSGMGDNIFKGLAPEQRRKITEERYIKEFFTPGQLRLKKLSPDDFIARFEMYAQYGGMSDHMLEHYCGCFEGAQIIETGGSSPCDSDYFIVSDSKIYSVNLGSD